MKDISRFLEEAIKLKTVKRAGWVHKQVPDPESVAEHSFMTAVLAYIAADSLEVDRDKLIRMALIHDMAESIVGDITPHDGVEAEEKHRKEHEAMETLSDLLGDKEMMSLWEEIEENMTPEAKILHQLDKLEIALQALQYEKAGSSNLEEFWTAVDEHVSHPKLREILADIQSKRPGSGGKNVE